MDLLQELIMRYVEMPITFSPNGPTAVLVPELLLGAFLCVLWLMASGDCNKHLFNEAVWLAIGLTWLALLFTCFWLYFGNNYSIVTFEGLLVVNYYTQTFKLVALFGLLPFILNYVQRYDRTSTQTQLLLLSRVFFLMTLVSSNSLLTAYLNIEGLSIMLYSMAGAARTHGAAESGLKYYGAGAAISAILLVGVAFTYYGAGSFAFHDITSSLWSNGGNLSLAIGIRLVILALLMKLAAVPGHVWTPDVYQGVPMIVTTFFATLSKMMVFVFVARLIFACQSSTYGDLSTLDAVLISLIAGLSILLGCFGALGQMTFKRFIAYASINQVGFLLIGLSVNTIAGLSRSLHYLLVYMVAGVALFAALLTLEGYGLSADSLSDLSKAFNSGAAGAVLLAFAAVLSMAGLPPFAGFFGKYALWAVLIEGMMLSTSTIAGLSFSALLGISVATSLFSMYYYLRVLKVSVFDQNPSYSTTGLLPKLTFPLPTDTGMYAILLVLWAALLAWLRDSSLVHAVLSGTLL